MRSVSRFAAACRMPVAGMLAALLAVVATPAAANDAPDAMATTTPVRVLAVVSGGFWSDEVDADEASDAEANAGERAKTSRRGYYRSVAIRSQDNTSRLFLQRIQLTENGPELLDTREIAELTDMKAYITDMRPEDSTGIAKLPGFVTFVYLKRDPSTAEPDTWELYVDEFGDLAFTPASN
ncbi:hypothetical protein [Hoeflea poritis]|uniref:Uncharacterized protein n=1 Tax=Hoeflea poritis TaxID=2993659 RepID=A0ABT4VGR3_9HYPH|nr:hypothetical protein [Hoeflea poritis]MDA4843887.1 hypothetical protein [Hoeflea poritis]